MHLHVCVVLVCWVPKVPDQEALPFKTLYALSYNCQCRIFCEPEELHGSWNAVRNAVKRADLQPALLIGSVMSQVSHGPFTSGQNQFNREQVVDILADSMPSADFQALRESMCMDRRGEGPEIPEDAGDLPNLEAVKSLSIFVGG